MIALKSLLLILLIPYMYLSQMSFQLIKLVNNDQTVTTNIESNVQYNNGEEEWKVKILFPFIPLNKEE